LGAAFGRDSRSGFLFFSICGAFLICRSFGSGEMELLKLLFQPFILFA